MMEAALALMLLTPADAAAHWIARGTIAWKVDAASYTLHADPEGRMTVDAAGVHGGRAFPLSPQGSVPAPLAERFPHLARHLALHVPALPAEELLRGQLLVSARRADGSLASVTGVQTAGVLDELFFDASPLGVVLHDGMPSLRVWAPTARSVRLLLYPDARGTAVETSPMTRTRGTWSIAGRREWLGRYYLYEVDVWVPATGRFETNRVTDPYSVSLSRNGLRSQVVDLDDPALAPNGWSSLRKPLLDAPEDISVYELHVRDFSASDASVPEPLRGTFKAFTLPDTAGVRRLRALASAGLTHLHLLPAFDIASIDEDRSTWTAEKDGFNWGYDPHHYTVPEGSYATDPEGPARIREFREMVAALNGMGLRVVMDVVYNHTFAAGQGDKVVLDRIVPGYYHRRDDTGAVLTSTCCPNTATENAMMERLMVDSVITWARAYKVDGFRFDLMGHHLQRNMVAVRQALDALTPARDGVDGHSVYVYGEGWDFGEMANAGRGRNATQRNMAGTGIGTFSDRLRDAARGGSAFGEPRERGFLTGLEDETRLRHLQDLIQVGIAGNLAAYRLPDGRRGDETDYNGSPAGYTSDPQEVVTYVEAHDNETLWDAIQMKAAPDVPVGERVRMQMMGMSLVALSQGVAFFHAGVDLLRSKSLDRNSYDSGDAFNRVDWTGQSNNWGIGLPPARDNEKNYPLIRPLLANPDLRVTPEHIALARAHLQDMLRIRRSSPLFRLRTAGEVQRHLRFLDAPAGVVAFELQDDRQRIVVVHNARATEASLRADGSPLVLHPVLQASNDERVKRSSYAAGLVTVPARTTAVFWTGERRLKP